MSESTKTHTQNHGHQENWVNIKIENTKHKYNKTTQQHKINSVQICC